MTAVRLWVLWPWHPCQMISTQSVWSVNAETYSNYIFTPNSLQQFFNGKLTPAPPTINQGRHSIEGPWPQTSPVWGQGGYVHHCWSGKGRGLAQIMGSCAGPWPKVHWWPQKLGESDYVSTPCSVYMPPVRGRGHYKRLSPFSCSYHPFKKSL